MLKGQENTQTQLTNKSRIALLALEHRFTRSREKQLKRDSKTLDESYQEQWATLLCE